MPLFWTSSVVVNDPAERPHKGACSSPAILKVLVEDNKIRSRVLSTGGKAAAPKSELVGLSKLKTVGNHLFGHGSMLSADAF